MSYGNKMRDEYEISKVNDNYIGNFSILSS
jgi:hypothetical protein